MSTSAGLTASTTLLLCLACSADRDAMRRWDVCGEADVGVEVDENSLVIACWDYSASGSGWPIAFLDDCSVYLPGASWGHASDETLQQAREWCHDEGMIFHEIDCEPEHWADDECPPDKLPDKMIACGPG
ncbi:hypothetical protein L6R53_31000 [Myxococcota bacterium]|nr:hypothetical protein [Myxococcota bacterium]